MKRFLTIALLVAISCPGFGQCIMLKVDLNDCIVHRSAILNVRPDLTGLPAYVVFPERARPDSADINFAGRFSVSKIELRFSDVWFQKLVCDQGRTCLFGLDRFGAIVYKAPLEELDSASLHQYIKSNQPSREEPKGTLTAYRDSLEFTFDNALGRLLVSNRYNRKIISRISSSTFDLSLIATHLTGTKKEKFIKYGERINKDLTVFVASFQSFRLLNDSTILMCYLYHNTPDSISGNITDEYAFMEYSIGGRLRNIRSVEIPPNMVIYVSDFLATDSAVYMPFWLLNSDHSSEPEKWEDAGYIARLVPKADRYVFDAVMPYKIPWYYARKRSYNYLSLNYSSFPYVTSDLGNEITNLNTGKRIDIINRDLFRGFVDTGSSGEASEQFHCYGVELDARNKKVVTIYRMGTGLSLNTYNGNLDLISTTALAYNFLPGAKFIWASVYPEINAFEMLIEIKGKEYRQYYLPLDLFY